VLACPSAVVPKGWWPDGLSHQEAPQASKKKHRKLLKKTRIQRRNKK
jgi:hypothetical protein